MPLRGEQEMNIREYIQRFDAGEFEAPDFNTQCEAGWYDWFCKESSLRNKTKKLTAKLKQILASPKINQDTMYVWFKNNCPGEGSLYDDFRIADIATGGTIYTIIPASGFTTDKGKSEVWGRENDFDGPLVYGTWKDVKAFFLKKEA